MLFYKCTLGLVRQLSEAQVVPSVVIKKNPVAPKKIKAVFIHAIKSIEEARVPVAELPPGFNDLQMDNLKLRRDVLEQQRREIAARRESSSLFSKIRRRSRRLAGLTLKLLGAERCKKAVERDWRNFWLKERLAKCRLPISLKFNRKRSARYKEKFERWKMLKSVCVCLEKNIKKYAKWIAKQPVN